MIVSSAVAQSEFEHGSTDDQAQPGNFVNTRALRLHAEDENIESGHGTEPFKNALPSAVRPGIIGKSGS